MNDRPPNDANEDNDGPPVVPGQAAGLAERPPGQTPKELGELIAEAEALALYVSRHGDVLPKEHADLHGKLLTAVSKADEEGSRDSWQELMTAYAEITAVTYGQRGVNGRTILDTKSAGTSKLWQLSLPRNRPIAFGVVFFCLALVFEALIHWSGGLSDVAEFGWWESFWHMVGTTLSNLLSPALWGGLGACIFLTKRISDKLFELAYEESRMRGDVTRIFLGSMLGVVVVVLIFPDFSERVAVGEASLGPATVAFVAGLGVKPVYAAFETLSEELARRFSGRGQTPQG
ncbi:MAG: hypothetical protein F4X40_03360 [Chloroflexi bacterium]|nr:hypothetical protein [Chloroflexota bacterium]